MGSSESYHSITFNTGLKNIYVQEIDFSLIWGDLTKHMRLGIIKSTSFREILEEKERPINRMEAAIELFGNC